MIRLLTKNGIQFTNKNAKTQPVALSIVRYLLNPKVLFVRPDESETPKVTNTNGIQKFNAI